LSVNEWALVELFASIIEASGDCEV